MLIFIVIALVLFFGKFIYDSYLTNNTNERWEEHRKTKELNENIWNSKYAIKEKELLKNEVKNSLNVLFENDMQNLILEKSDHKSLFEILEEIEIARHEFYKQKLKLGLNKIEIDLLIDNFKEACTIQKFRAVLAPENKNITCKIDKQKALSTLRKRPYINVGINQNIKVNKLKIEDNIEESLVYFELMNKYSTSQSQLYFNQYKYQEAIDIYMKVKVNNLLAKQLNKSKLATVIGVKDDDDIVIEHIIPQTELI